MSGKNVVIISIVIGVLVIFFTAILVAFVVQRRSRLRYNFREPSSSFKPGYDVDEGIISADVRSSITETKSPVTPTEFFSPGMSQVANPGDECLNVILFHICQKKMVKKESFIHFLFRAC